MSKILQRGAATALRMRKMSSAPDVKKLTPEQINELGRKLNPAHQTFGPKCKNLEEAQQFFQDPINARHPIYLRKGFSDWFLFSIAAGGTTFMFIANVASMFYD